jgi:hypothetical protein
MPLDLCHRWLFVSSVLYLTVFTVCTEDLVLEMYSSVLFLKTVGYVFGAAEGLLLIFVAAAVQLFFFVAAADLLKVCRRLYRSLALWLSKIGMLGGTEYLCTTFFGAWLCCYVYQVLLYNLIVVAEFVCPKSVVTEFFCATLFLGTEFCYTTQIVCTNFCCTTLFVQIFATQLNLLVQRFLAQCRYKIILHN